jgi:carbon-monoxide dehydrogenase medium subunit
VSIASGDGWCRRRRWPLSHRRGEHTGSATAPGIEAEVVAVGPQGSRRLPVAGFFTGPLSTALRPDEILTEIRVPLPPPRSGGAYLKMERKVGDFATAAVGVQLTLDAGGTCAHAGIGLTNVGPTPIKARRAEALLQGRRPDDAVIREAARVAADESDPSEDLRGSVAYKRDLVRVLTARAIRRALERATAAH